MGGSVQIAEALFAILGDLGVGAAAREIEPAKRDRVAVEDVVGPGEFEHHVEIAGIGLVGDLEVFQRILHIPRLDAALRHDLRINGRRRCGGARAQCLRHAEDGANAIGKILVATGEHAVEERRGGDLLAACVKQEAELRSG